MYDRPPADKICPFHRVKMSKVCDACPMWVKVRGTNPNTGQEVDGFNCALAWQPVLTIENSQQQRQTGAAVESLRNEMRTASRQQTAVMLALASPANGARYNGELLSIEGKSDDGR